MNVEEIVWKGGEGAKIFLLILPQIIKMIWVKLDLAPKSFNRFSLKVKTDFHKPLSFSHCPGGGGGYWKWYAWLLDNAFFIHEIIKNHICSNILMQEKESKSAVEIFYLNGIYR